MKAASRGATHASLQLVDTGRVTIPSGTICYNDGKRFSLQKGKVVDVYGQPLKRRKENGLYLSLHVAI
jgi:hypothetical protein